MSKFEAKVGDVASVLEAEETRKEAAAALSLGFKLQLCSEQIEELRREMCGLLRSFSPENKDVKRTMIAFCSDPYVRRIAKLQWIAKRISMLQQMDPDLDSKVKSNIVQLKSESFLSAMDEVDEECSREGVAGEGRRGQEVSMEMEAKRFAAYRFYWKRLWGVHNSFENQTEHTTHMLHACYLVTLCYSYISNSSLTCLCAALMSSMLYTHCTPRHRPAEAVAGSTLQVYSIKVSAIKGLEWPLEV
uniref:Uncharacterized protein n=1 Tax=Aegilops tauschii TaxID=37682 RepID=M8CCV5_AEGTA